MRNLVKEKRLYLATGIIPLLVLYVVFADDVPQIPKKLFLPLTSNNHQEQGEGQGNGETPASQYEVSEKTSDTKRVVVSLSDMKATLYKGDTVITTLTLVSKGKPGSYYETIGGTYVNDYKIPLHFSSIGHVYMPYSVHVFGNYFIHGIPYYEDGREVSSTYSGGCVRLRNDDAKILYDFVDRTTAITIVQHDALAFEKTLDSELLTSDVVTAHMAAIISLEALTQDNQLIFNGTTTTRRAELSKLLNGNKDVAVWYEHALDTGVFVGLMNQKATALGMTHTHFTSATDGATTSRLDYERLMEYINTHKSYLQEL